MTEKLRQSYKLYYIRSGLSFPRASNFTDLLSIDIDSLQLLRWLFWGPLVSFDSKVNNFQKSDFAQIYLVEYNLLTAVAL